MQSGRGWGPERLNQRWMVGLAALLLFYASLATVAVRHAFEGGASTQVASGGSASRQGDDGGSGVLATTGAAGVGDSANAASSTGAGGQTTAASTAAATAAAQAAAKSKAAAAAAGGAAGGKILIGIHDDDPGAAYAAYGVQGQPGSQKVWVDKIIAWINSHGGFGGRQVSTVHHVTQNLNGSFDQQAQDACTDFTEDHKVAVVVSGAKVPTYVEPDCLMAHKTPLVWEFSDMPMDVDYAKYGPYLYKPAYPSGDRMGTWIDAVADKGFFNGGKIGILRYDEPRHETLENKVIKPHLAAHGLQVTDTFAFRAAPGASGAADLSAQANSAILRFRSKGVDRIIFEPSTNIIPLIFITAATANNYRPKYTWSGFDSSVFEQPNGPPDQMGNVLAFGWLPSTDVDPVRRPVESPAAQLCLQITAGATPPGTSSVRRFCDGLFFLKAIFDRGAQPTPESMQAVAESLGSSWDSPFTFKATIGPGKHGGASVGRLIGYDKSCNCFAYVSGDIPIK